MTDKLKAMMIEIDRDHALFDTLIDQSAGQLAASASCGQSDAEDTSPCRRRIRELLAKYLIVSLRHFDQEYQVMHELELPRDLIEAHAIEHDALLRQVNEAIGEISGNTSTASLIIAICEISNSYRQHRDTIDAALLSYICGRIPRHVGRQD